MIEAAKLTLIVLSVLVLVGGIMGFVKAKSKASLIAGTVSAALLAGAFAYSISNPKNGLMAGDLVCFLLLGMFLNRLRRGAKFMPAGLIMILSGVAAVIVSAALATGQ